MDIFVFGGLWFWVMFAIVNIAILTWIELEKSGWATFATLCTILALNFVFKLPIFDYVVHNPHMVLYVIGAYVLTGGVWAVIKWWFYVRNEKEKYDEFKHGFLARKNVISTTVPENLREEFLKALSDYNHSYSCGWDKQGIDLYPQVGKHKSRIYLWMTYWPWSMLWTLINDPIRKLFRMMYNGISDFMQLISDRTWADVGDEIKRK